MIIKNIKIERLDNFLRGIGKYNNKIVFVDNAYIDEIVNIELIKEKKNYLEGKIVNIIKPSIYRIKPICPYFNICGGCNLQDIKYDKELDYKKNLLINLFKKELDIDINIDIVSELEYNYRNKITLHVLNNKLGLYKEKTNELVNIDYCYLVNNKINEIINRLNIYLNNNKTNLKKIIIRSNTNNNILISLYGNLDINKFLNNFIDIDSIYLNNKCLNNKEFITEIIDNIDFRLYPESFFQVNIPVMNELYKEVVNFFKDKNNDITGIQQNHKKLLDLYSETGTMSILISKYVNKVLSVEVNKEAVLSEKNTIIDNNIDNISIINGKVEDNIDKYNGYNYLIIDPPRSGIDMNTINSINKLNLNNIIYISCNPITLIRDLKLLDNYKVIKVKAFNMFSRTNNLETLCLLERKV